MIRLALRLLEWTIGILLGGWSILFVLFSPALPETLRTPVACALGAVFLCALLSPVRKTTLRVVSLVLIVGVFALWGSLKPSNDRDWAPEVAVTPWAEVNGDVVTVHNVRAFRYRTEQDFDPIYDTRTVKLSELSEVDFITSYWSGMDIAHIMVSFGFGDHNFLTFSVETRKERTQAYSTVAGFFRNYELIYIVADERDIFGVRTSYRNPEEQVYVFRSRMPLENARKLFLQYVSSMNSLRDKPSFYNTLTTNCTTQVLKLAQAFSKRAKYSWKILLSGHVPALLHDSDMLEPGMSLDELYQRGLINERSKRAGYSEDYSALIREGIPKPSPRVLTSDEQK